MCKEVKERLSAEEEYQQIRNEFIYKKLDRALKALRDKSKIVLIDTWNGINTARFCDNFNYNYFYNSRGQLLLKLKNGEEDDLTDIEIELQDIEDIEIQDNLNDGSLDELDNGYFCERIIIYLECGLIIRLELQW